jgi:hypothetical protein
MQLENQGRSRNPSNPGRRIDVERIRRTGDDHIWFLFVRQTPRTEPRHHREFKHADYASESIASVPSGGDPIPIDFFHTRMDDPETCLDRIPVSQV